MRKKQESKVSVTCTSEGESQEMHLDALEDSFVNRYGLRDLWRKRVDVADSAGSHHCHSIIQQMKNVDSRKANNRPVGDGDSTGFVEEALLNVQPREGREGAAKTDVSHTTIGMAVPRPGVRVT